MFQGRALELPAHISIYCRSLAPGCIQHRLKKDMKDSGETDHAYRYRTSICIT
jgi:hypothetical protein